MRCKDCRTKQFNWSDGRCDTCHWTNYAVTLRFFFEMMVEGGGLEGAREFWRSLRKIYREAM